MCDVNIKDFKKCTQENNYSYHKSSPCVFIKLNRIYGWVPEFYNDTNNLPSKMPRQLKHKIANETDPMEVNFINILNLTVRGKCWLIGSFVFAFSFCIFVVEYGLDIVRRWESGRYWEYRTNWILSTSRFPWLLFPIRKLRRLFESFSGHSFHATNTYVSISEFYISFFFTKHSALADKIFKYLYLGGIIINVECKAWAYNIKHDRKERTGSVHFELMID